jgi:hypothetical protein
MAGEYQFENGNLVLTFRGEVTFANLIEAERAVGEFDAQSPKAFNRLSDFTEAVQVDLDYQRLSTFAEMRSRAQLKNAVKSAIVVVTSEQFGFARMFQTLLQNPMIQVGIFKDKPSALTWLAEKT